MISVRRQADGSYTIVNGHARLQGQLQVQGKAEVVDVETMTTLHVYEIDGRLVALSDDDSANLEDQANASVNRARI